MISAEECVASLLLVSTLLLLNTATLRVASQVGEQERVAGFLAWQEEAAGSGFRWRVLGSA